MVLIGSGSASNAAPVEHHNVSPPMGGSSTARRMPTMLGRARKVTSVCQRELGEMP